MMRSRFFVAFFLTVVIKKKNHSWTPSPRHRIVDSVTQAQNLLYPFNLSEAFKDMNFGF